MSEEDVKIGITTDGAAPAAAELDKVKDALTGILTAEGPLHDSTVQLGTAFDSWQQKVEQHSPRAVSAFKVLQGSLDDLKKKIIDTYGTMEKAPADVQKIFTTFAATVKQAATETKELQHETAQLTSEFSKGGERFHSFGESLSELSPKLRGFINVVGGAVGAFTVGWEIGSKAAEKMGIDTSIVTEEIAQGWRLAGNALKFYTDSLMDGNAEESGKSMEKAALAAEILGQNLHSTKAQVEGLNIAIDAGIKVTGDLNDRLGKGSQIAGFYAATQQAGATGQVVWNNAVKAAAGNFDTFVKGLGAANKAIEEYNEKVKLATVAVQQQVNVEGAHIAAIRSKIDALKLEIASLEAGAEAMTGMTEAEKHLHDSRKTLADQLGAVQDGEQNHLALIKEMAAGLTAYTGAYDKNANTIKVHLNALLAEAATTDKIDAVTRKHIESLKEEMAVVEAGAQKQKAAEQEIVDAVKASEEAHRSGTLEEANAAARAVEIAQQKKARVEDDIALAKVKIGLDAEAIAGAEALAKASKNTAEEQIRLRGEVAKQDREAITVMELLSKGKAEAWRKDSTAAAEHAAAVKLVEAQYKALTDQATLAEQAIRGALTAHDDYAKSKSRSESRQKANDLIDQGTGSGEFSQP